MDRELIEKFIEVTGEYFIDVLAQEYQYIQVKKRNKQI